MLDFTSNLGMRARARLDEAFTVWLTTVSPKGIPQPRPVWFVWDGDAFLIFSQPETQKLRHIAQNPNVSLHFDGGQKGLDVQVFSGIAEILSDPVAADQVDQYMQKYGAEIRRMGASEEAFAREYRVALRVRPSKLRGFASQS
jgi:PPOX class probable F420-dependent enzyme